MEFDRKRIDKIPKKTVLKELRKVAEYYKYRKFTCEELIQHQQHVNIQRF